MLNYCSSPSNGSQKGVSSTPNVFPSDLSNLIDLLVTVEVEVTAGDFEEIFGSVEGSRLWFDFSDCGYNLLKFWSFINSSTREQLVSWLSSRENPCPHRLPECVITCKLCKEASNNSDSKKNNQPVSSDHQAPSMAKSSLMIPYEDAKMLAELLWLSIPYYDGHGRDDRIDAIVTYSQLFSLYAKQGSQL